MKKIILALTGIAATSTMLAAPAQAAPNPHIPMAECTNAGRALAAHDVVPCVWNGEKPFVIRKKSGVREISHRRAEVLLGLRA